MRQTQGTSEGCVNITPEVCCELKAVGGEILAP